MKKKKWTAVVLSVIIMAMYVSQMHISPSAAAASKPGKPVVSVTSRTATSATVQMKKQSGVTSYRIYMKSSAGGSYKLAGFTKPGSRTFKITKLKKTGTYWVRVRAYKKLKKSSYSKVVKIKPCEKEETKPDSSSEESEDYRRKVLDLVNAERGKEGLPALVLDDKLCAAADIRASELTQTFEHVRPDGTDCFTVFDGLGITYFAAGENIAAGHSTPQEVVSGWMDSPGHRANILHKSFAKMGIGLCKVSSGYQYYWAQLFTD